ncbi:hypothetical protein MRB53_022125 [Persea americana]|uniref:Uncharacterized protein n=1 Tax=Persea americana TaxID=3435 RepID=A0ACC2L6T3_PERAE|nr:hypothetical protein MRB53_022125 [Persea americana]|eukprot:TRINITY_DN44150_c0_g1_i3.p1 TRINITY_DN44150_c0_g1~~TRINITY_DN44150_c0_g1_i3.p1  ORF type:complete len:275 (+),score=57.24 TRINITY_DN44150_c0_g1_i3:280-1104(+)
MDLTPFKLDIDELLNEFVEHGSRTLADMKKVWLSRKFSYIFEARPTTNLAFFMQSLYAHALSHMVPTGSLSRRLGAFYCLYCLYETQPFKPPFKIYLSLGELRRLRDLVVEAKQSSIRVLSALVKRMMDRNMFLFGSVDINDSAITERINEITKLQNVSVQIASERLFANTRIEERLHMDLGAELDLQVLRKMSTEYEKAKELTIKEASNFVGMEDIKHIAESRNRVGDATAKISEEWDAQKELFYQRTGTKNPHEESEATEFDKELEHLLTDC